MQTKLRTCLGDRPQTQSRQQEEDRQVIELLRTPGLSIKYLDEPTKDRIRRFIHRTHIEKGVSLSDVSKMIGNKTSGYTSWLTRQLGVQPRPFEEARLKAIKEKRIYERRPFDGTKEDKAYLLGLRHGDISVIKPWSNAAEAIRVQTSTTHPAMAELFTNLFSPYGHVNKHSRYKKNTQAYEWNLHAVIDGSFIFLQEEREAAWKWIAESESTTLSYLAGVLDAEGSVIITGQRDRRTILMVCYYNTNLELLNFIIGSVQKLGYAPTGPYLDKHKGSKSSKYGIPHNKDYWHIALSRFAECQALLRRMPIKHPEKVRKAQLAISLADNKSWPAVRERVEMIRSSILAARNQFVQEAERTYKSTHPQTQE